MRAMEWPVLGIANGSRGSRTARRFSTAVSQVYKWLGIFST
jgi:hypothetical protein